MLSSLDIFFSLLSPTWPREMGFPRRYVVNSREDAIAEISANLAKKRVVFYSVYGNDRFLDKIYIDFDGWKQVLASQRLAKMFIRKDIPFIPVASRSVGIHLFPLIKPLDRGIEGKNAPNVSKIMKTAVILWSLEAKIGKAMKKNENGKIPVRLAIDTRCTGDLNRLDRMPGIIRWDKVKKPCFCKFLPFDNSWVDWDNAEFESYVSHEAIPYFTKKDMAELKNKSVSVDRCRNKVDCYEMCSKKTVKRGKQVTNVDVSVIGTEMSMLKDLLPSPLFKAVTSMTATYEAKTAAVIYLLQVGADSNMIVNMLEACGWPEWKEGLTRYHVEHLKTKMLPIKSRF